MKPVHILSASAAALLLVGCGSREPERIPANKKEIMDRFVAGTLPASYAPAGFFCHFPSDCKVPYSLVPNIHAAVAAAHRHE